MLSFKKLLIALVIVVSFLSVVYSKKMNDTERKTNVYTTPYNHAISIRDASKLTRNYRQNNELGTITGGFFRREAFLTILAQEECVGVRLYYGLSDDGKPEPVLVGVDTNGKDMINGHLAEKILPCPPFCDANNPLSTDLISVATDK